MDREVKNSQQILIYSLLNIIAYFWTAVISPLEAVCSFVSICLAKLINMALSYLSCVIQMAKLTTSLFTLVNRRPQRDLATKVVITLHEKYLQASHTVY